MIVCALLAGSRPRCKYCDKHFYNPTLMNRHIMKVHIQDDRLCCQICGHVYLRKDNLDEHIKNVHLNESEVNSKCKV